MSLTVSESLFFLNILIAPLISAVCLVAYFSSARLRCKNSNLVGCFLIVQVGARDKNYNFTNARVDVYPDKLKPNIFTLTLNKAQDKVFDAILVEVTKTIGSKKYKLKRNTGTSAIVISDKELKHQPLR
jgi:hypothetical protein